LPTGSRYKLNENSHFRRKNKGRLKDSAKLEAATQFKNRPIIVQSEMTMIGLLLNPTNPAVSPERLLPHERLMHRHAWMRAGRRLLNRWIAATIAYRERQTVWLELHRAGDRDLNNIYRGPIDDALEKAARLRQRFMQR